MSVLSYLLGRMNLLRQLIIVKYAYIFTKFFSLKLILEVNWNFLLQFTLQFILNESQCILKVKPTMMNL